MRRPIKAPPRTRRALLGSISLLLLVASAATVYAETASVGVTGGSLSVTAANVTLSAVTLNGTDQTSTSAAAANTWTGIDARGTGVGWNVTIDSTDFTDGGTPLRTIDISVADQESKIQLLDANIATTAGNGVPTSSATTLTAIPTTGISSLKFVSAAIDAGMGTYTMQPNFELEVRAETFVGTGTYTATITVTAVTAP